MKAFLRGAGAFVCFATALPLLRSRSWSVRVFDFPRIQLTALGFAALAGLMAKRATKSGGDKVFLAALASAVTAQLFQMLKYTPLGPKQVKRNTTNSPGGTLLLMTVNVRMKNRQTRRFLDLVAKSQPDLLLVLEPDHWWLEEIRILENSYPWHIKIPQDNTYGMALYSRLEITKYEVRRLVQQDVPSIHAQVRLRNGRLVWFYAIHPRPPVHGNLEGDVEFTGSGKRDAELIRLALELRKIDEPVLVAGDFNDVAWSHTTRRFQRIGNLLDPRAGRGLFNTYHAGHSWLRFPVDHLFHSKHFVLVDFARGPDIGSDHFPIFGKLAVEDPPDQAPPARKEGDIEEAVETLQEVREEK